MMPRSLRPFALALLAALAAACSASSGDEGAPPAGDGESEAEIRASCTNPRRYYLVSRNGPCAAIDGAHGKWAPEADPAFTDAPREVTSTMCVVRWSSETGAAPDKKALDEAVGYGKGLAPACGSGATPRIGELRDAEEPNVILGGSVGCDVCGILKNGHIWVILPPGGLVGRTFTTTLTNGASRTFAVQPNASPALSIPLPAAPRGVKYKDGVVKFL